MNNSGNNDGLPRPSFFCLLRSTLVRLFEILGQRNVFRCMASRQSPHAHEAHEEHEAGSTILLGSRVFKSFLLRLLRGLRGVAEFPNRFGTNEFDNFLKSNSPISGLPRTRTTIH